MTLDRADRLGSALLLWAGAVLLALYLLCNPAAAAWQERLGPTRLWGAVLGLVALGLALAVRSPWAWLLLAASLLAVALPPLLARWVGPAVGLAGLVLAGVAAGRHRRRQRAQPARPARLGRPARRGALPRRKHRTRQTMPPGRR
jgi:hypothetical protein